MDRRIKYTKKIITETFLSLLEEKEINKITVSEICKLADINRATFYRYYIDIYDLLDKIEQEFVEELKSTPNEDDYSIKNNLKDILTVFYNNKKLVKLLFNINNNIYFLEDVLEVVYEKCKIKWLLDNQKLTDKEIEFASIFLFNGALGIINYWVQNDFDETIDDLSKSIEKIGIFGLNKYIYKN